MDTNIVPKFKKVSLLVYKENPHKVLSAVDKVDFIDCGLLITGDYIIITIDNETENSTISEVFPLNKIKSYKTNNK